MMENVTILAELDFSLFNLEAFLQFFKLKSRSNHGKYSYFYHVENIKLLEQIFFST